MEYIFGGGRLFDDIYIYIFIIYIVVFQCLLEFVGCVENIDTSRTDSRTDALGGRVKYCIKRQL